MLTDFTHTTAASSVVVGHGAIPGKTHDNDQVAWEPSYVRSREEMNSVYCSFVYLSIWCFVVMVGVNHRLVAVRPERKPAWPGFELTAIAWMTGQFRFWWVCESESNPRVIDTLPNYTTQSGGQNGVKCISREITIFHLWCHCLHFTVLQHVNATIKSINHISRCINHTCISPVERRNGLGRKLTSGIAASLFLWITCSNTWLLL